LVDGARSFGTNQFANFYVYFVDGANAGKYARITGNTATTLTFAAVSSRVLANTMYLIVPPATVDDAVQYTLPTAAKEATDFPASIINSFTNPHYAGALATITGSDSAMWHQYPNKTYSPTNNSHLAIADGGCTKCHLPHHGGSLGAFHADETVCVTCHTGFTVTAVPFENAKKKTAPDYDNDGNATEGLFAEIEGLEVKAERALADYTRLATTMAANMPKKTNGTPETTDDTAYTKADGSAFFPATGDQMCIGDSHPYAFIDKDQDYVCEPTETTAFTRYTPRALRAAFNAKFAHAEAGAWAHNGTYVVQILMDTIEDLNAGITAAGGAPALLQSIDMTRRPN
jgi:predicted CXXCH cytochrome family protein